MPILIQHLKLMRIHADPDPRCESETLINISELFQWICGILVAKDTKPMDQHNLGSRIHQIRIRKK
jgi:hypothetical protein